MAKQITKKEDVKEVAKKTTTKQTIKKDNKPKLVECLVVAPFTWKKQDKAYKRSDTYFGTLERIEQINNFIYNGKRLNALQIVKSE